MSLKKDLAKYKPRKEQKEALNFIETEYQKNKLNKFFLLNLPVGVGKSHLALMIADWYRKTINRTAKVDIITNSKILQDQYSNTYQSVCDLKGKENYECDSYSTSCAQGAEFNRLNESREKKLLDVKGSSSLDMSSGSAILEGTKQVGSINPSVNGAITSKSLY